MANSQTFNLQLTGYVGSSTFSARTVRSVLAQYPGKHVDIMIDSFGGSLPEGLSICGAIRDHADVTVHFRGMNASAATIASMGAKKITIAPESMYLVHKVSLEFFDWASRNADQLDSFIKALQDTKEDLDKMDSSIAALYANRCKKKPKDLLDLMQKGQWLSAQEALEWGFVDDIAQQQSLEKPVISKAQAFAFQSLGLPLPPVAIEPDEKSLVSTIVNTIKNLISPNKMDSTTQQPQNIQPAQTTTQQPQNQQTEQSPGQQAQAPQNSEPQLRAEIDDLKAQIKKLTTPQDSATSSVVSTPVNNGQQEADDSPFARYAQTNKAAKDLFNSLP